MISIVEHIEYLLMHNDCVVIPQWGAMIAQREEASFSRGHVIPAHRFITFNAQVDHNDGLIATSMIRRHGVTYEQAVKTITSQVAAMRRSLNEGGVLPLGRLGWFKLSDDGNTVFAPFPSQLALSDTFGLRDVTFKPLAQLERERAAVEAMALRSEEIVAANDRRARRTTLAHRALRWAASIALLVSLGLVLTTHITVGDDVKQASLALPAITAPAPATVAAPAVEPVAPRFSEGMPDEANGKYILVVATLPTQSQVDAFVSTAKVKTMTLTRGKMNYVYVAQSDDYSALVRAMKQLPAAHRSAYVTEAVAR